MIEAFVGEDYFNYGARVVIVNRQGDGQDNWDSVMRVGEGGSICWEPLDRNVEVAPTFRLPPDAGRALLQALTAHYHGADDIRALRADYERALARGEKQDHVLADVVRILALGRASA